VKMILEWISEEEFGRAGTGFVLLRIGTSSGLL
jgi:hypothetical protein